MKLPLGSHSPGNGLHTGHSSNLVKPITQVATVDFLPNEVLLRVLGYLSVKDLCACRRVSTQWRGLASDSILWQIAYGETKWCVIMAIRRYVRCWMLW